MPDTEGLCKRCRDIDFEGYFRKTHPNLNDSEAARFPYRRADYEEILARPTCHLCRLLIKHVDSTQARRLRLALYKPTKAHWAIDDTTPWGAVDTSSIAQVYDASGSLYASIPLPLVCSYIHTRDFSKRPAVLGASADLDFARACWDHCRRNHQVCRSWVASSASPPLGLSLLDCVTLEVIKASTDCLYAALSYVWGPIERQSPKDKHDINQLPKTICDAVSVCLSIGIPYLWVDRYCIDCSDELDQAHQINNMHRIYQNATLTIVAECGDDSDAGLVGVTAPSRSETAYVDIGNVRIQELIPWRLMPYRTPRWWKRGWTLQEEFFSARKLFFRDTQLVFQCFESKWVESEKHWMNCFFRDSENQSADTSSKGSSRKKMIRTSTDNRLLKLWWMAGDFLQRELSRDSDALRAFTGVLQYYAGLENPILHLWGVPFASCGCNSSDASSFDHCMCNSRGASKTIQAEASLCQNLCWVMRIPETPPMRRRHFPSWSWASWRLEAFLQIRLRPMIGAPAPKIFVEYADGQPQPLALLLKDMTASPADFAYPQALHLNDVTVLEPIAITCVAASINRRFWTF